jgi:hypothetical protein
MDTHRFQAGRFDTRFVEQHFSMEQAESIRKSYPKIAAILSTLVAHEQMERTSHFIHRGQRDTSNWKWLSRWERMNR